MQITVDQSEVMRQRWESRKNHVVKFDNFKDYQIYLWEDTFGHRVFHITLNSIAVGYVACHLGSDQLKISSTFLDTQYRRQGIMSYVYKSIMIHYPKLVSDWDLSLGAKALWKSLSKDRSLVIRENGGIFTGRAI